MLSGQYYPNGYLLDIDLLADPVLQRAVRAGEVKTAVRVKAASNTVDRRGVACIKAILGPGDCYLAGRVQIAGRLAADGGCIDQGENLFPAL